MDGGLHLSRFEPEPDDPQVVQRVRRRAVNRRIYREMIKGEIADGRLTSRRRRELIAFAAGLEIDAYEAGLLLRAIEYECCVAGPARSAGIRAPGDAVPQFSNDDSAPSISGIMIGLAVIVVASLAIRAFSAVFS